MQMSMRETATVSGRNSAMNAADSAARSGSGTAPRLSITVFDKMSAIEAEWRALERDNLTSLHQSYDWCAAWVETYHPPLAIIRGSFGSEIAFILPLEIVRSRGVRVARFIGAPRSNINTGLFSDRKSVV